MPVYFINWYHLQKINSQACRRKKSQNKNILDLDRSVEAQEYFLIHDLRLCSFEFLVQ